jgi:hypothetical protein
VPSRQNTLASSPGPLEILGPDQRYDKPLFFYVYGFAALYSLISTRAGALPKFTGRPPGVADFVLAKRAILFCHISGYKV